MFSQRWMSSRYVFFLIHTEARLDLFAGAGWCVRGLLLMGLKPLSSASPSMRPSGPSEQSRSSGGPPRT
jgi:hypothetical protein